MKDSAKGSVVKAFLLAAGLGSRLRPLTDHTPKCLLPIGGKPLLEIWLEHLASSGIEEVLVNTHWLAEQVDAFLDRWDHGRLPVTSAYEPALLGSAGTIVANLDWAQDADEVLILYADNLTTVRLPDVLCAHDSHELPFTLGVFHAPDPRRCGIVETDADLVVTSFVEKPDQPLSDLAAGGVYVADASLLEEFAEFRPAGGGQPFDLGQHVLPHLTGRMKAHVLQGLLLDIGTSESYLHAQALFERQPK